MASKDIDDDALVNDPFSIKRAFPNAESIFSFRPRSLESIKNDCLVVLDTNVLLVPYTISAKNMEEIRRTYGKLSQESRLKLPGQVAREFAKNRAYKLAELNQQLVTKRDNARNLHSGRYPLLDGLPAYGEAAELEKEIDSQIARYKELMKKVIDHVRGWNWDDPVSQLYSEIFTAETIVECKKLDKEIEEDLKSRNDAHIPPGYKDAAKSTNSAGDLLIWHTILQLGHDENRSVLLVSGDGKPDWWQQSAGQPLYPRFELVDEFRRESGGQSFHILKLSDFLDLFGAEESAVKEVRSEETTIRLDYAARRETRLNTERITEDAVYLWLIGQYPDATAIIQDARGGQYDLLVHSATQGKIAASVKAYDGPPGRNMTLGSRMRDWMYRAYYEKSESGFNEYMICLVSRDETDWEPVIASMARSGADITISAGHLDEEGQYKETFRYRPS